MAEKQGFGAFFRKRRKALGLPLREFCRQNGLDPGNISRLERGLLKPPQSSKLLTEYGNSLKLAPGSSEWDLFFDLAAAETGRVPIGSPDERQAAAKLTQVLGVLRRERRQQGTWTTALDLDSWADFLDARSQLPRLIRRLIRATTEVERLQFPAGEGIQRPGWDGLVEAKTGNDFVPAGVSVWELGTDRNIAKKAEQEFAKRTNNPLGLTPGETSFIFVTPRKWQKKNEWCQTKKALGIWRDVRVYDSADIEEWLEIAPAVDAWFARLLGRTPETVTDIEDYWADVSAITKPSLKPGVFLASRQAEIKWLEDWLSGPPASLAVEARSPAEVLDFLAAYIMSPSDDQDEEKRSRAERIKELASSRTLIVERDDAWQSLSSESGPLVLAAKPGLQIDVEMVARAVRNGHHVLLSSHRFSGERTSKQTLPRSFRHDLEQALVGSGFHEQEAARVARESGGSLTVLKRRVTPLPSTKIPPWSDGDNAAALAPLALIGAWNDSKDADRRAVETIAGRSYANVLALANRWSNSDDAPLMRILSQWSLMSREDAWVMLGPHVTRPQLEAFEEVALQVLGEYDPQLDLPEDERLLATFQGKVIAHSAALRTGLAETLGLLGSRPEYVQDNGAGRADRIVRQLLSGQNWKRWASLARELPVLAEAAPEAFLEAVRADVNSANSQLARLFVDDGDSPFSSCRHAGLLWALEGLAWSADHLSEVTDLLARLHQLDKGGKWSNRPLNSLLEIFLPWLPQTTVGVQGRIKTLRRLTERIEDVGWQILLKLLPSWHGVSTPTHRPAWRPWVMDWQHGVTNAEYSEQVQACAARLVEMVGGSASRWKAAIEHIEHFPETQQVELIRQLHELDARALSVDDQRLLTDAIREKVQRHRAYADQERALPVPAVEQLEAAAAHLEPQDVVARHTWLFAQWPRLLDDWTELSSEKRDEKLSALRHSALREVLAEGGIARVLELAKSSESPGNVGYELARLEGNKHDRDFLPQLLTADDQALAAFARSYTWARFRADQWDLTRQLGVDQWQAEQIVAFGLALWFENTTWNWIESHEEAVVAGYWRKCGLYPQPATEIDLQYVVSKLLAYGRPFSAIHVLATSLDRKLPADPEQFMQALEGGLLPKDELHENDWSHVGHDVQELFNSLQKHPAISDRIRLAKLEWAYLGLLDGHGALPATLHELLQSQPEFFVSVLQEAFRSENENLDDAPKPTEEDRKRAMQAYRLLKEWETVPGSSADRKSVDQHQLDEWVRKTRTMVQDSGHLKVCDQQIGEVFAHSPPEPDGSWPCIPVRDALDDIDTEEVEHGFVMGIIGKRGVYMKSPFEGGAQERALVAKYLQYAEACQQEWPRAASGLRSVARHYEDDAIREDARAETRK